MPYTIPNPLENCILKDKSTLLAETKKEEVDQEIQRLTPPHLLR